MIRIASRLVVTSALLAFAASAAFPETPTWEESTQRVLMTRHHWRDPVHSGVYSGLWDFDPATGALRSLRPLTLTSDSDRVIPYANSGDGISVATVDHRVVVQMWPYYMDIEAESWRLLRRYPPAAGLQPVGWAAVGPMLSTAAASPMGLAPGLYGFAHCFLPLLASTEFGPQPQCEPQEYSTWEGGYEQGDTSLLVRRSLDPVLGELTIVGQTTPQDYWFYLKPTLSFDPERGAFWRGGQRTIELLPVTDGVIGSPSLTHELDFPPFDREEAETFALYYHPQRRRFFGLARELEWGDPVFFSLDEDLSLLETYDIPHDQGLLGWPIAMTSLATPPTSYVQTVPIVSSAPGRYETSWSTDLWLYNPSPEPMTVQVRRVQRPDVERAVDLPAQGSVKIADALTWIGGGPDGDGTPNDALVLTSPSRWGQELVAVSRTFTGDGNGGTYGQAVPAVPGRVGYSNHLPYDKDGSILLNVFLPSLRASNLTLDRRTPGQYRHNLGVVNDGDEPVKLTLVWGWVDPDRDKLEPRRPPEALQHINVAAHTVKIVNLEEWFPSAARDGWPPRIAVFGDRPALLWLSMADNLTGDATFVPYTNFHFRGDRPYEFSVLPAAAHTPGREGTFWVTDLYGYQGNVETAFPTLEDTYDRPIVNFYPERPAQQCGGASLHGGITDHLDGSIGMPLDDWIATMTAGGFPPSHVQYALRGWRMVFPDVVHLFAECAGEQDIQGGLEIATQSWTAGYSRTYTTREDGGTYGSMLPLYPPHGWPVQHFAGIEVADGFRINVGFFNGDHEHAITHRVTLYAADGSEVASAQFELAPLRSRQDPLEELLGLPKGSLASGTYGLTVEPLDDDEHGVEGRSWAYVSVVDNTTGDPANWW